MCAANSAGGVMGKMVDAQSITIATAATEQVGNEGKIFRFVFWHSIALGSLVGIIVMLYAYVFPHGTTRADVREVDANGLNRAVVDSFWIEDPLKSNQARAIIHTAHLLARRAAGPHNIVGFEAD